MKRFFAFLGALFFAFMTVSSACVAAPADWVHFTLDSSRGSNGEIYASFRSGDADRHDNNWSSGLRPSELIGLDIAALSAAGTRPIRFAIVREAGRLDCAGNGGNRFAGGDCRFTEDPRFVQALVSRGIARPTREQAFGLMALNVRRDLIDTLAAARYPTPTIDDLMALTALGATAGYINGLARVGYRPQSIHALIEFKALAITPEWIGGISRLGYADTPSADLVQLKALAVTPDYIAGFQRLGYRRLPVSDLVQMKALGITPDFVSARIGGRQPLPPVDDLVEIKIFGRKR